MKNRRSRLTDANVPSNNLTTSNETGVTPITPRGKISRGKPRGGRGSVMANTLRNIGNSLFDEIMVPAIRSTTSDFVTTFVNSLIFGDNREDRGRSGGRSGHRSYNRQYRESSYGRQANRRRSTSRRDRAPRRVTETYEQFEDVFFQDRQDAQLVLDRMKDLIDDFDVATVLDLYTMVGSYSDVTHQRWGWTNLDRVRVVPSTEGHLIDFPEPRYLD